MSTDQTSSSLTRCAGTAQGGLGVRTQTRLRTILAEVTQVLAGTVAIALIGQVALPLPFTPVPVTLGTLAVLGVGSVLGSRRALASVALFVLAACLGVPVLAGWGSGVTASFGYVLGYGLAAVVAGRGTTSKGDDGQWVTPTASLDGLARRAVLMLVASALVYVPGVLWLKVATGAAWGAAFSMGVAPFVVGDVLKSLVAALVPARRR
ncbi:biotin transporter BioY [Actinomyces faecalis]|uniref:biotin transporter BioY n=1 Tax=Actinomyces faecalis TaxID=2722820 RepID=UPI001556D920|nr:biotin transporter BioY [Actinomyces faecalis]